MFKRSQIDFNGQGVKKNTINYNQTINNESKNRTIHEACFFKFLHFYIV